MNAYVTCDTYAGKHFLGEPEEIMEMVLIARKDLNMSMGERH